MPNWCNNWLVVTGENTRDIVDKITPDGLLFENLVGGKYQGNDGVGTKWDVPMNEIDPSILSDTELAFAFSTAWSPPTGFCQMLSEKYKVHVRIEYEEGGCDFAGYAEYDNGELIAEQAWGRMQGLYMMGRMDEFWSEFDFIVECGGNINLNEYRYVSKVDMNELKQLKKNNNESNIQNG